MVTFITMTAVTSITTSPGLGTRRSAIASELPAASTAVDLPAGWPAIAMRVAGELFLTHGYGGASLAAVMTQTGGSFRDLYSEFGSKEGLFLRAMQQLCDGIVSPWRSLDTEGLGIEEALVLFGKALLSTLLSPRLLALHRLILYEAPRFPELAQLWYEKGPYATSEALAALLLARSESQTLALDDVRMEAGILIDSIVNELQMRRLVGLRVTESEVDKRVQACVRIFLNGIASSTATCKEQKGRYRK